MVVGPILVLARDTPAIAATKEGVDVVKILQVINSYEPNERGAQALALEFHRSYLKRGFDSHLLALMESPQNIAPNSYSLGFKDPYQAGVLFRLRAFLRERKWQDVDVIHAHLFPAQPLVALLARFHCRRAKLVTTEHNTFNHRREMVAGRWFDHLAYKAYEKVVCSSEGTRESMARWQPALENKLVTIPNGIDLSKYSGIALLRDKHGRPIVISVGRICEQKNYAAALQAICLMRNQHTDYWIVGQDELNGQVQQLAATLGLTERVHFLGFREDIADLLRQADVFLLTSHWEGFGLAAIEAMSASLPVVASNVPRIRELVGAPENDKFRDRSAYECGYLVDAKSPASIARTLDELVDDEALRCAVGRAAHERSQLFDISHTVESYLQLYHEMLGASRGVETDAGSSNVIEDSAATNIESAPYESANH
jgi:glycosyltransferase involved in cell wall biosynthesis